MIQDEEEVCEAFWAMYPEFTRPDFVVQNDLPCDVRCAFVDFVDQMEREGQISSELAANVTLSY